MLMHRINTGTNQHHHPAKEQSPSKTDQYQGHLSTAHKSGQILSLNNPNFQTNRKIESGNASIYLPKLGTYKGSIGNYMANGEGEFRGVNGSFYKGMWKDDRPNGKGMETNKNGEIYEGEFLDGRKHGFGVMNFKDGSIYEGSFRAGEMHG